jgi:tetratricopeptide (TPR) repeat protein
VLCYLHAVAKGISRKDLRQPDEFVSFWTHAAERANRFAAQRKRELLVVSTMIVTAVVGSVVFATLSERKAQSASDTLARIDRLATAELRPEGSPATNPDGTPLADDGVPHFKTEKERAEATLKELDGFIAGSGNPLRAEGRLRRGPVLLTLGRAPEAVKAYEEILSGKLDDRLRFLAHEGLGYAHEQAGDLPAAIAAFEKLEGDAAAFKETGFYKDRAAFHKARIAELRGNADDAKKLYREVLDKNPTTSLRDEITNRLAVLETQPR